MTEVNGEGIGGLSIGAVARATGIGIETLRMWERRYGAPKSFRLPSGHRRYHPGEVDRLLLVAEAMKQGFRAGEVAAASQDQLGRMLARGRRRHFAMVQVGGDGEPQHHLEDEHAVDGWMEATKSYDDVALGEHLRRDWSTLGALRFVKERAMPFLERVGNEWRDGELAVSHEHFASEKLGDFLSTQWRQLNEGGTTPAVLVASLPGDLHRLGLQLCALTAALNQRKVLYIGSQTPPVEIVRTTEEHRPAAVCLSISSTMDPVQVSKVLRQLRLELPAALPLVIGGSGAPQGIDGVTRITDLEEFGRWLKHLS